LSKIVEILGNSKYIIVIEPIILAGEVNSFYNNIVFSDADIYRVEPINEPFWTNEQLLPLETSSYEESYNSSKRYFNPRKKDLGTVSDEYLIQGRVKILEKVDEIRFKHTK
jgi:hypothetical protein